MEVRSAVNSADGNGVPNAVAGVLDALYELVEYWQQAASLTMRQADDLVSTDVDGETTAALVRARGVKTHSFVEFGTLTDTYSDAYFDTMEPGAGKRTRILTPVLQSVIDGTQVMWPCKRFCHR